MKKTIATALFIAIWLVAIGGVTLLVNWADHTETFGSASLAVGLSLFIGLAAGMATGVVMTLLWRNE